TSFFLCASSRKTVFTRKRAKFPFFSRTTPPGSAPDLFHRPPSLRGKTRMGQGERTGQQAVTLACCVHNETQADKPGESGNRITTKRKAMEINLSEIRLTA
ncbi:hypothetical protein, partial [uncultured Ruegeria sp.]|uniref:hypothetical protein n=1 Tax=uncultured Ruegeria sp. TaxID=259304 RepID=UPI002624D1BE